MIILMMYKHTHTHTTITATIYQPTEYLEINKKREVKIIVFHIVNIYNDFQCNVLLYFSFFFSKKRSFSLFHLITAKKLLPVLSVLFLRSKDIEVFVKKWSLMRLYMSVLILFTFHLSNKCLYFCGIFFI